MNVDLDEQFLKKFFGLSDKMIPEGQEITVKMLNDQLNEVAVILQDAKAVEKELKELKAAPQPKTVYQKGGAVDSFAPEPSKDAPAGDTFNLPKKNILVIDDLGVITYQLSVILKKMGYETAESKEIYDAIEKFKKQDFDLVVMDLFIPTEREGLILLEELKKTAAGKRKKVIIGVMSASSKKEHKQLCKIKGAEFYVEKIDDWQKELLNVVKSLI